MFPSRPTIARLLRRCQSDDLADTMADMHLRIPAALALSALVLPTGEVSAAALPFHDGDRVVLIGNTLIERSQRYGQLETALVSRFADRRLTFRNLGWSGDTVWAESRGLFDPPAKGYQRMLAHVKRLKPTVLVLGYGSNESFAGAKGLPRFLEQYRRLISDLVSRSAPKVRVILLSIPPQQRPGLRRLKTTPRSHSKTDNRQRVASQRPSRLPPPLARNRQIEIYNTALAAFAGTQGHVLVDLSKPFARQWDDREQRFRLLFTEDGRAINQAGYSLIASATISQLCGTPTTPAAEIRIDPLKQTAISGSLVSGPVRYEPGRLQFAIRHPSASVLVRVDGLPRGRYDVRIDGRSYGKHKAGELATGLLPDLSQAPSSHESLRRAIVAKNRLYFHRWRPQNTTYLFGFRKHEQGNNAREVAEFEKLVAAAEAEIDRLKQAVIRRFEIVRGKTR
ncbi:MAG: hypothetical protein CMJ65_07620 [Planctomycetaceae bacterium]|nr:hypothetical protein [Planctomycetaceae bacterium]